MNTDTPKGRKQPSPEHSNGNGNDDGKLAAASHSQVADRMATLDPVLLCQILINHLPFSVLLLDPDDRITLLNPGGEFFFGTSAATLNNQDIATLLGFGNPLLQVVNQVREKGAGVNEYGIKLSMPKFSEPRLVDAHVSLIPDLPGHLLLVLQERNMAQMIERQLNYRGAAMGVSAMAAMLAHEIKNPLSGIRGAAQLLEPGLGDQDRGLTRLICTETDRICSILDRMDIFSEHLTVDAEPINIHAVLDHVVQLAKNGFASHIRVVSEYDPSLPALAGNRDKLIQIFLNLVKNAAEAIGAQRTDGEIRVMTAFKPGVRLAVPGADSRISLPLEITIEDNGPGISAELRDLVFDPFITSKPTGSGLGLALVAKLVRDHGGLIEFDSYPGKTRFYARLPLAHKS